MKKQLTASFLTVAIAFSSGAFADDKSSGNYYSAKNQPSPKTLSASAQYVPPTDITVINGSYNLVYVIVPGSPINDGIYPGDNDHIRHDSLYGDTRLVLADPYHNTFFDRYVCRRAIISVMGNVGSYRVNIDNEYCL